MHSSKVYGRLGERLGLTDHLALLNAMLTKIGSNLRVHGQSEQLVHLTLQLFQVGWRCVGVGEWMDGTAQREYHGTAYTSWPQPLLRPARSLTPSTPAPFPPARHPTRTCRAAI